MIGKNHKIDSIRNPLAQVKLPALMGITAGSPDMAIGVIDGPVDLSHPALEVSRIRTAKPSQLGACRKADSLACMHGTAVVGILSSKRDTPAPAICPNCEVVIRPVFTEETPKKSIIPSSTPQELSEAIIETVDAGARVINLSLGMPISLTVYRELEEACTYARKHDAILVAAAGNQGNIGYVPLLNHSWIIPVAGCDEQNRPISDSNFGPSIGKRGLIAPGRGIQSISPGGGYAQMGGTSVAAPFVTGTIALLWSEFPNASAADVRNAVIRGASYRRRTIIPPLLNAMAAWDMLALKYNKPNDNRRDTIMLDGQGQDELIQHSGTIAEQTAASQAREIKNAITGGPSTLRSVPGKRMDRVSGQGEMSSSCSSSQTSNMNETDPESFHHSYIYALGTIEVRFPNMSVEKEFAQAVKEGETANLTDKQVMYRILTERRYLVNEVCWIFTIEGIETYILTPYCPMAADMLVEAIKPAPRGIDLDAVIGVLGPSAPPEACNGLQVPIVIFNRIYSFEEAELIKEIPKPKGKEEAAFRESARELFERIQQMADNTGATDEHRALNYLSVRYPKIYTQTHEMNERDFSLTSVDVIQSRLSTTRKLVDVIFAYMNRNTDIIEKYYVRVDVTEKWPFLDRKLAPFYERV